MESGHQSASTRSPTASRRRQSRQSARPSGRPSTADTYPSGVGRTLGQVIRELVSITEVGSHEDARPVCVTAVDALRNNRRMVGETREREVVMTGLRWLLISVGVILAVLSLLADAFLSSALPRVSVGSRLSGSCWGWL
jgi:hypothetical protein